MREQVLEILKQNKCIKTHKQFSKTNKDINQNKICDFFELILLYLEIEKNIDTTIQGRSILNPSEEQSSFLCLFTEYVIPFIKQYEQYI